MLCAVPALTVDGLIGARHPIWPCREATHARRHRATFRSAVLRLQLQLLRLHCVCACCCRCCCRCRRLRVQPFQPSVAVRVPTCFTDALPRIAQAPALPACLPALLPCPLSRQPLAHAESQAQPARRCSRRLPCTGTRPPARVASLGTRAPESRPISAHGPDEALLQVCRHPRARLSVPTPGRSSNRATSQASPMHTYLGAPGRICAFGHCHQRLHCTWGLLPCPVFDIIMLRPPDSPESECLPLAPICLCLLVLPRRPPQPTQPAPLSMSRSLSTSTIAPPYPHPSPLYLFVCCVGVGVGDAVLVDSPCRPASRLPCCPAASTAQCSVARDWTAHPVCPPSSSRQNLARGRNQPSTSGLQPPHRGILHPRGSPSSDYKQTGGIHELQPGPALLLGAGISAPQSALPQVTGTAAHPCPQSDSHYEHVGRLPLTRRIDCCCNYLKYQVSPAPPPPSWSHPHLHPANNPHPIFFFFKENPSVVLQANERRRLSYFRPSLSFACILISARSPLC